MPLRRPLIHAVCAVSVLALAGCGGSDGAADTAATTDVAAADSAGPATGDPDTQPEDTVAPDTVAPDTDAPDTVSADTETPDTAIPDTDTPDTDTPDTDTPDTDTPDTDTPDTDTPDTDTPDTDTPDAVSADANSADTTTADMTTADTTSVDTTSADTSPIDTTLGDVASADTEVPDAATVDAQDAAGQDAGLPDAGDSSDGSDDSGDGDAELQDAGPSDTNPDDAVAPDTTSPDTAPADTTPADPCAGKVCDDKNPCTDDACDPAKGCVSLPNQATCSDGDPCTAGDACVSGGCTAGEPKACDDGNPCTDDSCEAGKGCVALPNKATCDDGVPCTLGDVCHAGACKPGYYCCTCTSDAVCAKSGNGNLCMPQPKCLKGPGVCTKCGIDPTDKPVSCDPSKDGPCQKNHCEPKTGKCALDLKPDGVLCDDGDVCTAVDACAAGACKGGKKKTCDDGNPCTADSCDPKTGCVAVPLPANATCSDGDPCTEGDACADGTCKAGPPKVCADHACAQSACDAKTGQCSSKPAVDGTPCGVGRVCVSAKCAVPWATQVVTGRQLACALRPSGQVWCWGLNKYGGLGRGDTKTYTTPGAVSGISDAVQIDIGSYHVCALRDGGEVRCWGLGSSGQLGHGKKVGVQSTPVVATGAGGLADLSLGFNHTVAGAGLLFGAGSNASRQIHVKSSSSYTKLTWTSEVGGADDWEAGGYFTCGRWLGRVRCWGNNSSGQLGRGFVGKNGFPGAWVVGLTDVVQLSAGGYHACARLKSGAVRCWGSGGNGRLGDGAKVGRTTPVVVKGLSDAVDVQAGSAATCAVRASGVALCWGANKNGQLGDGTKTDRSLPTPVKGNLAFASVSPGVYHSCGLLRDGRVACWGLSTGWRELGFTSAPTTTPKVIPNTAAKLPGTCVSAKDCGVAGPCGAWSCTAGTCVATAKPAGAGCDDGDACTTGTVCNQGRCGGGKAKCDDGKPCTHDLCNVGGGCVNVPSVHVCDDGDPCTYSDRCAGGACKGGAKGCNDGNACTTDTCDSKTGACTHKAAEDGAACSDGSVCTATEACQGGVCKAKSPPKTCADDANPCTAAACDAALGCVQVPLADGAACGAEQVCIQGQCRLPWATQVSAGSHTTCVRHATGKVSCWGLDTYGQRGRGKEGEATDPPTEVPGLSGVRTVRAGGYVTCATLTDGSARCWGWNGRGQIGTGAASSKVLSPAVVKDLSGVVDVRPGYTATCARLSSGQVRCWGSTEHGQLGYAKKVNVMKPTPVQATPWLTGLDHTNRLSCARDEASQVWCWGPNLRGEAGQGSKGTTAAPRPVFGGMKATAVSAGSGHACALRGDGTVWCWGQNTYGQVGDGTTHDSDRPRQVAGLTGAVSVSCGYWHSCALRQDGSVWCWGRSTDGQTGLSYGDAEPVARRVISSGTRQVSAGYNHTCALSRVGVVRCWGRNSNGALGIGKTSWTKTRYPKVVTGSDKSAGQGCTQASQCLGVGPCTTATCVAGACVWAPKTGGCDDGDACTTQDTCQAGRCVGQPKCTDDTLCTNALCDPKNGGCAGGNAAVACEDGKPCTIGDACAAGVCKAGGPKPCDDKQACTTDACDAKTGACVHLPQVAGCAAGNQLSGTITFDNVPTRNKSQGGPKLDYAAITKTPARRVVVQALAAGKLVAETTTNDAGKYTMTVPTGVQLTVRALARVRAEGAPADGIGDDHCNGATYDLCVVDNTNGKSLYAMDKTGVTAPATGVDLHAALVYQDGKYVKRTAAPFAIAHSCLQTIETVCQGKADLSLPLLTVNWSVNNAPVSGDKTKGQVGSANHFTTEQGAPQIYLKGLEDVDTAEFHKHTIAHEFGHYLERFLFRSETIGGSHAFGQLLNIRTAFGEGYGNGLSGIVWADPVYVSVKGKGQKGGFDFDFRNPMSGDDVSFHSEMSVAHALYRLWDARDPKPDSGSFDRIYAVLAGPQKAMPALTSMHSFVAHYNAMFGSAAEGLAQLVQVNLGTPLDAVCAGSCSGKGDTADLWDVDNDLGKAYAPRLRYPQNNGALLPAAFWQAYPLLASGLRKANAHDQTRPAGYKAPYNKQGGVRMYRLVGTGQKLTVRVLNPKGAACTTDAVNLYIRRGNDLIAWDSKKTGPTAGCPQASFQSQPGLDYVVVVRVVGETPPTLTAYDLEVKP